MEPLEQIARDVRVIRRVIELLVLGALIVGVALALDGGNGSDAGPPRPDSDSEEQLCEEFPQLC